MTTVSVTVSGPVERLAWIVQRLDRVIAGRLNPAIARASAGPATEAARAAYTGAVESGRMREVVTTFEAVASRLETDTRGIEPYMRIQIKRRDPGPILDAAASAIAEPAAERITRELDI